MTGNVAPESGLTDSPTLSILSSPAQASESPSAATDRVFFGPVRSPEKKFARRAGSASFRTPVRRSARLSHAMVPLPLFAQQQATGLQTTHPGSRLGTPDEDGIPDEPSVVLANRVLSASGNPSPPPSPLLPSQTDVAPFPDVQLLDVSDSPQPQGSFDSIPTGPLIPIDGLPEPTAASSPPISRQGTPSPNHAGAANTSQPDLIAFDSFSVPHDDPPLAMQSQDQQLLSAQPSNSTVDDLLSMSPNPVSMVPSEHEQSDAPLAPRATQDAITTPDEEMEVVNSLIIEPDCPVPSIEEADNTEQPLLEEAHVEGLAPETSQDTNPPLRRSTRPRKSRNSLPEATATPPQNAQPKLLNETPEELGNALKSRLEHQQVPQPSPARKRKLKAYPQLGDKGVGSGIDVITPKRPPQPTLAPRELGPLSPVSAAVLTQLLPQAAGESVSQFTTPQPQANEPAVSSLPDPAPSTPQQAVNLVFPKVGQQTTDAAPDIQRPRSPLRPFPSSMLKPDEVTRTPARRVPIAQAVAEGTYSAQKLPALFGPSRTTTAVPGTPVFRRPALDDPARSPAKRVPMSEAVIVPRVLVRARVSFVLGPRYARRRENENAAAPPNLDRSPGGGSGARPQNPQHAHLLSDEDHSIPEADEPGPSTSQAPATSMGAQASKQVKTSPAKPASSLRQPSVGAGSKIPRIGVKPYARSKSAGKPATVTSKLPTPAKSRVASKPLHIVNVGSSSGSSSDEGHSALRTVSKPTGRQITAPAATGASSVHGQKRKRDPDGASKQAASATPAPIPMRRVVPGMFNKGDKVASSSSSVNPADQPRTSAAIPASPAKAAGPIRARSAVNWKRPQPEGQPPPPVPSPPPPAPLVETSTKPPTSTPVPQEATLPTIQAQTVQPSPKPTSPPPHSNTQTASEGVSAQALVAEPPVAPNPPPEGEASARSQRRSTRSKRTQERAPVTDLLSARRSSSTRASKPRRKPGPLPSETAGPFAGFTQTALGALTLKNTRQNQQQVAVLATEVVRKEGPRPGSPTTKARTALELQKRQREERVERAARRARRSAGSDEIQAATAEGEAEAEAVGVGEGETDGEGQAEVASPMHVDQGAGAMPLRHRRGAGDEEEYGTPPRPERLAKRARFDGGDEKALGKEEKRVKWDKGLYTTVILEEETEEEVEEEEGKSKSKSKSQPKPKPKKPKPKPKPIKRLPPPERGCLTPAAKSMRLDTMGNVLNAGLPVGGLVPEKVVVKKFVFEDDVVVEVASPAPAKSTRSKSKKAKS
ncbi:hypothetical protein BD413DRAFT_675508 [Trametes elegans]|nr:hypothetical protein BD413DRAFT_675508 [Trametes elegans]